MCLWTVCPKESPLEQLVVCSVCKGHRKPSEHPWKVPGGSRLLRGPRGATRSHLPLCCVEVTYCHCLNFLFLFNATINVLLNICHCQTRAL